MLSGHSRSRMKRNRSSSSLEGIRATGVTMKPSLPFCLLMLTALVACSKKSAPPTPSTMPAARSFHDLRELPGTIADITLTGNTIRIDERTTRHILKSVGSDGNIYVFDDSDPHIQNLHEGQILFLENIAVQKVLAVVRKDKFI